VTGPQRPPAVRKSHYDDKAHEAQQDSKEIDVRETGVTHQMYVWANVNDRAAY
jgi:hypothetical protein